MLLHDKHDKDYSRNKMAIYIIIAIFITLSDQLTKIWVASALNLYNVYPVMSWLNITRSHNHGAAFGILADAGGWQRVFFIAVALGISALILTWLKKIAHRDKLEALSLSLILGGAIGNLLDRVFYGYVIDFIDVYYKNWHFHTFNIADSAITLGAIGMLLGLYRK